MEEYICKVCGYVYDPAVGDAKANIDAGIPFEALDEDWVCPQCGADRSQFEPENEPMPGLVVPAGQE